MEVHALKLSLSEQDLNDLVRKYLPANQPVEKLYVQVGPTGLTITGVYPVFIKVSFETLWEIGLDRGQITAKLSHFKALGMPGSIFKSTIVKIMKDLTSAEEWLTVQGETLWVDVDRLLGKYACAAKTNFKSLECQTGRILLES